MKILKSKVFNGFRPLRDLTTFINDHGIVREDILTITQAPDYTLFYYSL